MATLLVLSHFLDSSTYGAFAIAVALLNFANLFKDFGTSINLISKNDISQEDVNAAHTVNVLSGCLSAIVIIVIAYPVGWIYKNHHLTYAIFLLGLTTAVTSLGIAKLALLQRYSRFKEIAVIDICAGSISALAAIAAANAGAGIYSLVIQGLLSGMLTTIMYTKTKNKFHTEISKKPNHVKYALSSGNHITAYNFIHYLTRNGDIFVIGKFFGEAFLGLYTMSLRFVMLPYQVMTVIINKALLPILSLKANNVPVLRMIFINTNKVTITLSGGFVGLLWVFSSDIVTLSLGESWINVAKVLYVFSPSGFVFAVTGAFNTFLIVTENKKLLVKFGLIQMTLTLASIVVSANRDFYTLIALMTGANFLFGILITIKTCRVIGLSILCFIRGTSIALFRVLGYIIGLLILRNLIPHGNQLNLVDLLLFLFLLSSITYLLVLLPSYNDFIYIDKHEEQK